MHPTFSRYYVDPHRADAIEAVTARLATDGLVTVDRIGERHASLALAWSLGMVVPHRDSDMGGVTVLAGTKTSPAPGDVGLSRQELTPHTDGSSLPHPPTLVMLVCVTPAPQGGQTLLVDGRALYEDLAIRAPRALAVLSRTDAARFGDTPGRRGAIFDRTPAGRTLVRWRDDDLVAFSPDARQAVAELRRLIHRHTMEITLDAGEGYIVQNGRWLHGRTTFTGRRVAYRILIEPFPADIDSRTVEPGFAPPHPSSKEQRHQCVSG